MKIVEDERQRSTEGVNLSGDRKIGNCNRIALRRIPRNNRVPKGQNDAIKRSLISQAKGQRQASKNRQGVKGIFYLNAYLPPIYLGKIGKYSILRSDFIQIKSLFFFSPQCKNSSSFYPETHRERRFLQWKNFLKW